jgi:general secretion pathway protein M
MSALTDLRADLSQRYADLAPRERVLVALMGLALAFLLVWMVAVQPAWRTLDRAPALRAQADLQWLQVQALAGEARQLRALPPVPAAQAQQLLQSATAALGGRGKLVVQSDQATLTLNAATGEDIRQWLAQARSGAHARPVEADLTRAGEGYSGTLVVSFGSGS